MCSFKLLYSVLPYFTCPSKWILTHYSLQKEKTMWGKQKAAALCVVSKGRVKNRQDLGSNPSYKPANSCASFMAPCVGFQEP